MSLSLKNWGLALGLTCSVVACNEDSQSTACCEEISSDVDSRDIPPDSLKDRGAPEDAIFQHSCYDYGYRQNFVRDEVSRVALSIHLVVFNGVNIEELKNEVRTQIASLNDVFVDAKLEFYVSDVTEIEEGDLDVFSGDNNADDLMRLYRPAEGRAQDFINVLVLPKVDVYNGLTNLGGQNIGIFYSSTEDVEFSFNGILAHEVGHYFYLHHTFENPEVGDYIRGTFDYYSVCGEDETGNYDVHTKVEDGVCMVSCGNGCFEAPANIMGYSHCGAVNAELAPDQIRVMNCFISEDERLSRVLDSGREEIKF